LLHAREQRTGKTLAIVSLISHIGKVTTQIGNVQVPRTFVPSWERSRTARDTLHRP